MSSMSQMKKLHICINEFHSCVLDPNSSQLSTHPQAFRFLSNGWECQFVIKKQPGIVQVIPDGLNKGFFSVAASQENVEGGQR